MLTPAGVLELVDACLRDDPNGPDYVAMLAEEAHDSLAAFVWQCWSVLEPGRTLEWGWHLDLICRTLERVTAGELQNVLICVPPGTAKSLIASVYWPAWWWLRDPGRRYLTLSSSDAVAIRDSRRMREVVKSPWYQRLVAEQVRRGRVHPWAFARDQDEKVRFENTARGGRFGFSTGGSVTGERGDGILIDDPHQVKDVLGSTEHVAQALGKAHDKVDVVLPSRVNDRRTAWRVTILQRVHQDDVAGRQLEDPEVYKVVLPMHAFAADHPHRHPDDPRAPGELLDPVRMPEEVVRKEYEKLERQAPGQGQAQHELEPVAAGGGTFKRAWTNQRYTHDPQRPPVPYTEVVVTVDTTFKKTQRGSFVSIQAWGRRGWTAYHLLDEVHERMGFLDTEQALLDMSLKWNPNAVLVEDKANGPAVLDALRQKIPALIGFNPNGYGDKEARAQLATPMWQVVGDEVGVWLPSADMCPWVLDYVNELCAFPAALDKDRVDTMSQLFLWWAEQRGDASAVKRKVANLAGVLTRLGRR